MWTAAAVFVWWVVVVFFVAAGLAGILYFKCCGFLEAAQIIKSVCVAGASLFFFLFFFVRDYGFQ